MHDFISKKERFIDFIFVLSVVCLTPILFSIYLFISGQQIFDYSKLNYEFNFLSGTISKFLGIVVLVYVLRKQRRTIHDIGYSFNLKDIIHAILLVISACVIYLLVVSFIQNMELPKPKNLELFKSKITVFYFLAISINPWYEELILRAFVISEVKWFTQNIPLAVFISVFIQAIGHLYQGLFPAIYLSILFLIFSIYYVKTSRITPVILAHLFFDIVAMLTYSVR